MVAHHAIRETAFSVKFNIYGRYDLEVVRTDGSWVVYRIDNGKRRPEHNLIVPTQVRAEDLETYLDDLLHELASPGTTIQPLD